MNLKNLSIIAAIAATSLIAFNAPAHATAYRSSGGTYLELKEGGINANDVPGAIGTGRYKSGSWNGTFSAPNITLLPNITNNGNPVQWSRRKFQGSFQSTHVFTGQVCTGQITIIRYNMGQGVGMVGSDVTWANSPGCSLINGGNTLSMAEPLPYTVQPNFDFTAPVVNVLKSNTATWWRWQSIDPTPLNCRAGAGSNNSILYSFTQRQQINARSPISTGTGNGIVLDINGKPWMKVQNPNSPTTQCYVRANSDFIQAQRLGF